MTPEEESEWLALRYEYVTGSRIATLMGENPWSSEEELLQQYLSKEDGFKANRKMEWGKVMEEGILYAIQHFTNWVVRPTHRMLTREYTSCTLDALVEPASGCAPPISPSAAPVSWRKFQEEVQETVTEEVPLDVKLVGNEQLKRWNKKGQPPRYYWCQMQWQMLHTDTQHSLLIAKVGAHDLRGHLIERDDLWLDEAESRAEKFMNKVRELRGL